jgi:Protein kinase domain
MPWPTPQDYNEAIQNPKLCFDDPELKAGEPEYNTLGLPRPITGGFASVYRMHCGQRDWAVRCFLREFTDQQQRYTAISQHLAAIKLPYIVGFEFLSKGIRVKNQWYAILKMEWVQGELLHEYIKKRLNDPSALRNLAEQWQAMMKALREASIGHGDLQHGNVLVTNGDLRLIDYDGVFVPALGGQRSHEVGHRNYQHPSRTAFDFGIYLDNFAAWVIYVSLVALHIDHRLWHQVGAGDEFILFREEDFVEPDSSSTFRLLTKHTDTRIQELTSLFRSLLYLGPQQIPALDEQPTLQNKSTARTLPAGADWLTDHVKLAQPQQTSINNTSSSSSSDGIVNVPVEHSAWALDYIVAPETSNIRSFSVRVAIPRITALMSIVSLIAAFTNWYFIITPSIFFILSILVTAGFINREVFLYYYRRDPAVVERKAIRSREERESRIIDSLQHSIKDRQLKKKNILAQESKKKAALTKQMSNLQNKEQAEMNKTDRKHRQGLNSINNRRLGLHREETDALRKLLETLGYDIAKLNQKISSLVQAESNEISSILEAKQNQFVRDYLSRRRIIDASISGIGDKLKIRLRAAGIHTAADITHRKVTSVEGIGLHKGNALVRWRDSLAAQAKMHMPTSLSQLEVNSIKQKYEPQKRQVESQRDDTQRSLVSQESAIRNQYAIKGKALENEQVTVQYIWDRELQSIRGRYAQEYALISQRLAQLATEVQTKSRKIDEDISNLQKQIFNSHWQIAKSRRDIKSYKNVSFRHYIRFVFLGRKISN